MVALNTNDWWDKGPITDIVIENVFASKDPPPEFRKTLTVSPLIWFQGGLDVGRVSIRNLSREETKWDRPTFQIEKDVKVKDLIVRDVKMVNRLDRPITFYDCEGRVENPVFENLSFEGAWKK